MTLDEIRRRPTLPGRFQPSTISVLRLNFCVRDGNRWIPQAIITGNWAGPKAFCCRAESSSSQQLLASHPQNRTGWIVDRMTNASFNPSTFSLPLPLSLPVPLPSDQDFRFSLPTLPKSFLPRSSPRPISITKLHALLHFHR